MPFVSFAILSLLFAAPCPITTAPAPQFVPPPSFAPALGQHSFWFGTPDLWTELPASGELGRRDNKMFWWHPGFDGSAEPSPNLSLSIEPLDGRTVSFVKARATNAFYDDRWSMLTMVEFPTAGCWKVTGSYQGHSLTFVAAVR